MKILRIAMVLLAGAVVLPAHGDVYYTEVVELNDGVTIEQIAQNWQRHLALWKKSGWSADETALSVKTVGQLNPRRMSFYFKAANHAAYGAVIDEISSDPEWQEISRVWDELRVIVSAEIYQTID